MVLPNEHATLLMLFDLKNVHFSLLFLLRIIASETRSSQCVNHALLGETSRAHFPVSPILRDISAPRIVETIQCVPWAYKQLAGRAILTRTRASSRDTPRRPLGNCLRYGLHKKMRGGCEDSHSHICDRSNMSVTDDASNQMD